MTKLSKAAIAALGLSIFGTPALANDLGIVSPGTVEAAVVGSTEMIIHIPQSGQRGQTVDPIDVTNSRQITAVPGSGQILDMSGADGSLRSCYANGGIAKQGGDLMYRCEVDTAAGTGPLSQSAYVTPPAVDSGYNGTQNVEDPALLDCMDRGGSLIQLSSNGQFACAM